MDGIWWEKPIYLFLTWKEDDDLNICINNNLFQRPMQYLFLFQILDLINHLFVHFVPKPKLSIFSILQRLYYWLLYFFGAAVFLQPNFLHLFVIEIEFLYFIRYLKHRHSCALHQGFFNFCDFFTIQDQTVLVQILYSEFFSQVFEQSIDSLKLDLLSKILILE